MLRCMACGRRLTGDTGYYRHRDACTEFMEAQPVLPPTRGRHSVGRGYRSDWYEEVVTKLLSQIHLDNSVIADVVAELNGNDLPDPAALSRIDRERAAALQRLQRDRDVRAWEAATLRLDVQEAEVRSTRSDGIPAGKVVEYLRGLPVTWQRAKGGTGRRLLAETLFSEVRALGFREMEFELTAHAVRMGLEATLPSGPLAIRVSGYGRGERI